MGSDKDKSCGGKLCCYVNTFGLLFVAGTIAWYFIYFAKDIESLVGDCGGCYCIPDKSTSFECPSKSTEAPPMSYPEETHLNAWKSQTILNPYLLNCNPYEDGVFCDTEPSLDPDFEWIKLGETAVCAIHYEQKESQQRGLEEQQAEIQVDADAGSDSNTDEIENITNIEEDNDIVDENYACENNLYYRIKTYPSREDAELAGGFVTHMGNCGVCSALQDLAVYANVDFIGTTSPGNFCRRQSATSFQNGLACYRDLGMTQDCAKIWADTSWNTAKNCFGSCVLKSTSPQFGGSSNIKNSTDANSTEASNNWYDLPATLRSRFSSSSNETDKETVAEIEEKVELAEAVPSNGPAPECALNACITCNDEVSTPTFEKFAGRSRRRSGILSTAARPCSSIPNIIQDPCPITQPLPE